MKVESSKVVLSTNSARLINHTGKGFNEIYSKIKASVPNSPAQSSHTAKDLHLEFHKYSPVLHHAGIAAVKTVNISGNSDQSLDVEVDNKDDKRLALLKQLLEKLTGKKIKFHLKGESQSDNNIYHIVFANSSTHNLSQSTAPVQNTAQNNQNSVPFKSEGSIRTSDGREIRFSLESNLNAGSVTLNVPNQNNTPVDPLVVNFGNESAGLSNTKFNFDLNSDGKLESISFTTPGSGFLALDSNNDGIINNGSELFGPTSGDGFSELAKYDKDSNNWIDENDEIFDKLKIWSKDANGNETLDSLVSKGIGAIFLGSLATNVNIPGSNSNNLGQVAETGVFLRENGTAGTIQHVNLNK